MNRDRLPDLEKPSFQDHRAGLHSAALFLTTEHRCGRVKQTRVILSYPSVGVGSKLNA
jgi:hypothetical protein